MNNLTLQIKIFINEMENQLIESDMILLGKANKERQFKIDLIVYDFYMEFDITPEGFNFEKTKKMLGL